MGPLDIRQPGDIFFISIKYYHIQTIMGVRDIFWIKFSMMLEAISQVLKGKLRKKIFSWKPTNKWG
jgi:hypothetical protein